jgi:soluble lytic murein transglycosylase
VTSRPANYYALRVAQVRAGDSLTATRLISAAIEPPAWNSSQAQDTILAWLRDWAAVPDGTQLLPLPDDLARHPNVRRGEALLAVGLRRQALDTLDRVRAAAWEDPVALAQLALYFQEQGMTGLAARSAYRLAGLWPGGSIAQAPVALQQIAYPLAYPDLLSREAQARDLDPLLLAALIRQESLFEPVAESYAGARGLGQVMPATGRGLARNLGLEGFDLDDLYRPAISARFAAYYLEIQMGRFDHNLLIALAAYNGGPGNTLRWLEGAGDDLDLFVELITANQSRVYLQRVYSQYLIYERLYRSSPGEQQPQGGGD